MGNTGCDAAFLRDGVTAAHIKELFAKKLATTAGMKMYYAVSRSHKRDSDYSELAYFCSCNKIDPRPFIDWAFMKLAPSLPQSPALLSGMINEYLIANKPDIEYERTAILIDNMADRLKILPSGEDPLDYMLNPINEFSCVFVYCVAYKLHLMDRLPRETVQCANEEIFLKPVYLEKFSTLVPPEAKGYALMAATAKNASDFEIHKEST